MSCCAAGRADEALVAGAVDARGRLDELGAIEEGESLVRQIVAETLAATGDITAARVAADRARDRLHSSARRGSPTSKGARAS